MFSFGQDSKNFYNKDVFECAGYENNETLQEYIQNLRIPSEEAKNISKYFKENLANYFETEETIEGIDKKYIFIKMKRNNDTMNCES